MNTRIIHAALLPVLALLVACGGPADETANSPGPAASTPASFLLKSDLTDAIDVKTAKKSGEGDELIVFGRVRGELDGSAAFTIIDTYLPYCGEGEDCRCTTPWDYCCEPVELVAEASLPVEVRNETGDVVDVAKDDLRLLDLVAMKGKLVKTESGGLVLVVTDGWFRRERPDLPDNLEWPE